MFADASVGLQRRVCPRAVEVGGQEVVRGALRNGRCCVHGCWGEGIGGLCCHFGGFFFKSGFIAGGEGGWLVEVVVVHWFARSIWTGVRVLRSPLTEREGSARCEWMEYGVRIK